MINRRHLLGAAGGATAAGVLGGLNLPTLAAGENYKAVVVIHINGGCDGNNLLIPTDAAYTDYATSRANLAFLKAQLANLPGAAAGHTFGLHPSLAPLVPLYTQQRMAVISNVGPLVEPSTGAKVIANQVKLPPFLMSHSDQTAITQGWTVTDDNSGWAGRALELLPSNLRNPISAITVDTNRTLVLGKRSAVSFMPPGGARYWGTADLAHPETQAAQSINRMAQWQFANNYEAEYARTLGAAVADSTRFTQAFMSATPPAADFGTDDRGNLGNNLSSIASVLPIFKSQGIKRQVFLTHWGSFDTHTNQRGTGNETQDNQFIALAKALAAFDATNLANGLDQNIVTLVMTEFGRTLRPGSGGGSEHAWGNHWLAMGGPVAGGNVLGSFPSMVLGGPDDGDANRNGRHVPSTSSDQVGATLMQWLGLPANQVTEVFPNLVNFSNKTISLLRA